MQTHSPHAAETERSRAPTRRFLDLLAFSWCALLWISCAGSPRFADWVLRETALTGDERVLSKFEGQWHRVRGPMMAEVDLGTRSRLALRVPPSYTLANARAAGDDIYFSLMREGKEIELSLTFLADGVLVMIPPGIDTRLCGPGTPRLIRPTAHQLVVWRAGALKERVSQVYHEAHQAIWNWLIDVL